MRRVGCLVTAALIFASAHAEDRTFDQRTWSVGYNASDATQHITEYVIQPETVDSWSELVTSQVFSDPKHRLELASLAKLIRSGFEADCRNFKWTILEESKSSILYEWSHDGCASYPPQYEVSRIFFCKKGVCHWAYASKLTPLEEAKRESWRKIISNLTATP